MPAGWQEFRWDIPHSMELCLLWEQGLGVISEPCAEALVCQMSPSVPPAAVTILCHRQSSDCPRVGSHPPSPRKFWIRGCAAHPQCCCPAQPGTGCCATSPARRQTQKAVKFAEFEVCVGVCRGFSVSKRNGLVTGTLVHPCLLHNTLPRATDSLLPSRRGR